MKFLFLAGLALGPQALAIDFAHIAATRDINHCEDALSRIIPDAQHDPSTLRIGGRSAPAHDDFIPWAMRILRGKIDVTESARRSALEKVQARVNALEEQADQPIWNRDEEYRRGRFVQFFSGIFSGGTSAEQRRLDDDLRAASAKADQNQELLELLDQSRETFQAFRKLMESYQRVTVLGDNGLDTINEQIFQWLVFRFFTAWNTVAERMDEPQGNAAGLGFVQREFEELRAQAEEQRRHIESLGSVRQIEETSSPLLDDYLAWKTERFGTYLKRQIKEALPEGRGIEDQHIPDILYLGFKHQRRLDEVAILFADIDAFGAARRKARDAGEINDQFDILMTDLALTYGKTAEEVIQRFEEIDVDGETRFGNGIHDRYIPMLMEISFQYGLNAEELVDYLKAIMSSPVLQRLKINGNHGAGVYLLKSVMQKMRKTRVPFDTAMGIVLKRFKRVYESGFKNQERPERHQSWTVFPLAAAILTQTSFDHQMSGEQAVDAFFEVVDALEDSSINIPRDENIARVVEFRKHYGFDDAVEVLRSFEKVDLIAGEKRKLQRRMTVLGMTIVREPELQGRTDLSAEDFDESRLREIMNLGGFVVTRIEDALIGGRTLSEERETRRSRSTPSRRSSYSSSSSYDDDDDDFGTIGFGLDITGGGFSVGMNIGSGLVIGF